MYNNVTLVIQHRLRYVWPYNSLFELNSNRFSDTGSYKLIELFNNTHPYNTPNVNVTPNTKFVYSMMSEERTRQFGFYLPGDFSDGPPEFTITDIANDLNIDKDQIHIILNSFDSGLDHVNTHYVDYFSWFVHMMVPDEIVKNKSNKGLFFIGKAEKFHRIRLLALLYKHNILDSFDWSFYLNDNIKRESYQYVKDLFNEKQYDIFIKETVRTLDDPLILMQSTSSHCNGFPYDINLFKNTKFSLISETGLWGWVTEKTFKAIVHKHPFIIANYNYPILEKLKKLGYKTFEEYLPYKYDQLTDNHEKLDVIIKNVIWMINNDLTCMADDVEYNYNLFRWYGNKTTAKVDDILEQIIQN